MPVVSSSYWNVVFGQTPDEVMQDLEGLQILRNLGRNMAWLMKCIEAVSYTHLDVYKRQARGKLAREDADALLSRIAFTTELASAKEAALVIEAIVERADVKKSVFQELDGICSAETIFASNTSSISITDIASATKRPDRCIGMHFFNCLLYTSRCV